MGYHSNMTSKGQVTVPKDIRLALGLLPGQEVEFELSPDGHAILRKADDARTRAARKQEIQAGVMEARRLFRQENCLPEGMTADEWFELMRGPPAEV
jgi:AbrB family looped-hinge helix DNA binding protein